MKPPFIWHLLIIILFVPEAAIAQQDFITLKRKNKTVHSWYAGTQIEFVSNNGGYRNALITEIKHDTLFLQEFLVRQMVTRLGFYITDTAGSFRYAYNYKEINSIGKKQKGFDVSGSGAALLGGGTVLTLANGVVFFADRNKFSPAFMAASVALATAGYFMSKSGGHGIIIGKKHYRLEYVKISP